VSWGSRGALVASKLAPTGVGGVGTGLPRCGGGVGVRLAFDSPALHLPGSGALSACLARRCWFWQGRSAPQAPRLVKARRPTAWASYGAISAVGGALGAAAFRLMGERLVWARWCPLCR
jgi:hypothetical protein